MELNIYNIYQKLSDFQPTLLANKYHTKLFTCEFLDTTFPPFHSDTLYVAQSPDDLYKLPQYDFFSIICCFPEHEMYDYTEFIPTKDKWNYIFLESKPNKETIFRHVKQSLRSLHMLTQFSKDLFHAISENASIQQLAEIAYEYIQNSVYVFDTGFQMLASMESPNAISPAIQEINGKKYVDAKDMDNINYMHNHEKMKTQRNPVLISNKNIGADRILCMIDYNRDIGHFVFVEDNHPFNDFDFEFANVFRLALNQVFSNDSFSKNVKGFQYEYFLSDLLSQKYAATVEYNTRLKYLDNAFSKNLFCIVIETARSMGAVHTPSIRDYIERAIHSTVTVVYENQIIAIVSNYGEQSLSKDAIFKIASYCEGNGLYCGLSNSFDNILNLYHYYKQALRAIEIGSSKKSAPGLFLYEKLHLIHAANIFASKEDPETYCCPQMKFLINFDKENDTELAKTLYYYILLGNTNDTAAQLYVHRNTILYRINMINDLIHTDLKDASLRHYLLSSYEMLHPDIFD